MAKLTERPFNPDVRQAALDALDFEEDPNPYDQDPSSPTPEPQVDKNSGPATLEADIPAKETETSEHAGQDTPDTSDAKPPSPAAPSDSPPEKRKYANRFDTVEELENWVPQVQAWATRETQEKQRVLAENEKLKAQLADMQRRQLRSKPPEELTDQELAELEQEGKLYGMDPLTYRSHLAIIEDKVLPRVQQSESDRALEKANERVDHFIRNHPNYEMDREAVAAKLEADPMRMFAPDDWSPQQKEERWINVLQATFAEVERERKFAALERELTESKSQLTHVRQSTLAEQDQQKAMRAAATTSEASTNSKPASPPSKPAPRDAGDELLEDARQAKRWWTKMRD